ncbi:MAG: SH3 domain-containing protein [Myxococcota bacterium]
MSKSRAPQTGQGAAPPTPTSGSSPDGGYGNAFLAANLSPEGLFGQAARQASPGMPYGGMLGEELGFDAGAVPTLQGGLADLVLNAYGAHGATDGESVLLRSDASPETARHEAIHVLQPEGAGGGAEAEAEAGEGGLEGGVTATRGPGVHLQEAPAGDAPAPAPTGGADEMLPGGRPVNQTGKVAWDGDPRLRLRSAPSTDAPVAGELAFDTTVQILSAYAGGWSFVATADGRTGYAASDYLWSAPDHPMPEPNAHLKRVPAGEDGYAINIARQAYGFAADDWGQDLRFYVNVLAHVNGIEVPDSVDGWRSVSFQADRFIWVPSQAFAASLQGVVSSGSYSYEAADSLGVAQALERVGEIMADLRTAVSLSMQYIPEAVGRHATESFLAMVESLLLMAAGAVGIVALSSLIGGAIGALAGGAGALPGAAAGAEVGFAILEWLGLGFLLMWIGESIASIGGAFVDFLGAVVDARGDQGKLEVAARLHAEAWGEVVGVAVEALVMYAAANGIRAAVGMLRGTRVGRSAGEEPLTEFFEEQLGRSGERTHGENTTLTNVNADIAASEVLPLYNEGSAFSGAYNPETGNWIALASEGATLKSGEVAPTVSRFGGHQAAEAALMERIGGADTSNNVGFVLFWEGGSLRITWNSGSINARNFGDRAAPERYRAGLLEAIQRETGLSVSE